MLLSMTAFSRAKMVTDALSISVEMHSVNKKFLDVQLRSPPEWQFFESSVKKIVQKRVLRGQVTVHLAITYGDDLVTTALNEAYIASLKKAYCDLAKKVGVDEIEPLELFKVISRDRAAVSQTFAIDEAIEEKVHSVIDEAIDSFLEMKKREGALLEKEFQSYLTQLKNLQKIIEDKSQDACLKYRQKLNELLQEFTESVDDTEMRIAKEVAIFADRVDIAEELVRFWHHISHFEEVMQKVQEPVGKKLEFILQELLREVNTMGSKCQDAEISRAVIECKSIIEKMKEQVQNVE